MDDGNGADPAVAIGAQPRLDRGRIDAAAPVAGQQLDFQAQSAAHLAPHGGEVSGLEHQHPVSRGQDVDQGRLPAAGPGGGEEDDGSGGRKYLNQAFEYGQRQWRKLRAPVIDDGARHGAQDAVRHIRRARYLQEVATRCSGFGHDRCLTVDEVRRVRKRAAPVRQPTDSEAATEQAAATRNRANVPRRQWKEHRSEGDWQIVLLAADPEFDEPSRLGALVPSVLAPQRGASARQR